MSRLVRIVAWFLGSIVVLVLAVFLAFQLSPRPGAWIIRQTFTRAGREIALGLVPHLPPHIVELRNLPYDSTDPDALLDVFRPDTAGVHRTVIWIHGGAWVAGSKDEIANYLRILADRGFTVIGVDYSLAPAHQYPTPVRQTNQALRYLFSRANRLGVDTLQVYLAGDSGGAQIAAQLALILSDSSYAAAVGITPTIDRARLAGVVLFCGPYDITLARMDGPFGGFLRTVLWSYSGRRDFPADSTFARVSVARYVTAGFPPAFVSVGNADPLAPQSKSLATALQSLAVPVDTLFYPDNHPSRLPHEYQFNLDTSEGQEALDRVVRFLQRN